MKTILIFALFFALQIMAAQPETFCSPAPVNANTAVAISFSATNIPVNNGKYYTNQAITTTGTLNVTNNKFYSATKVSLTNGFKAVPLVTGKFIAAVGPCNNVSSKETIVTDTIIAKPAIEQVAISEVDVVLFPNPADQFLNINLGNVDANRIAIIGIDGKIIFQRSIDISDKTVTIDVGMLAEGIYSLIVSSDNNVVTKHFVKSK
ncbi:T9SS type A sorting domain-containing protein [Flavobacterium branchiophilum]|uniref:Secretion system C-terminal sorting domain-containing protein n=1 Tax=Flavobacterium branchiophilum TaxID=55197 RepID=A0A2H3KPV8_9FLAO|nr:T9SS type A sorting domain-containing protein [Flavobacterium branchiophilum]PDS23420.1 hypothetical protein B0A77_10985 [Flavobacterium branchiophilum]